MNCPHCGSRNRSDASFCLECGESLNVGNATPFERAISGQADALTTSPAALPPPTGDWRARFDPRRWPLEARLLLLVVLVAVAFDLYSEAQSRSDVAHYHTAEAAIRQQQWHRAADSLRPLLGKHYLLADSKFAEVNKLVLAFDEAYKAGEDAERRAQQWQAAFYFGRAASSEQGYRAASQRAQAAYTASGKLLFRRPDGLYLSEVDGSNARRLPDSESSSYPYSISPDGSRILYSYEKGQGGVVYYDTTTDQHSTLPATRSGPDINNHGFLTNNGKGVLLSEYHFPGYGEEGSGAESQNSFRYYDVATASSSPSVSGSILLPLGTNPYSDTSLYYMTDSDRTSAGNRDPVLYRYDLATRRSERITQVKGMVQQAQVVGQPPSLLYLTKEEDGYSLRRNNLSGEDQQLASLPNKSSRYPSSFYFSSDGQGKQAMLHEQNTNSESHNYWVDLGSGKVQPWPPNAADHNSTCQLDHWGRSLCSITEATDHSQLELAAYDAAGKLLFSRQRRGSIGTLRPLSDRYFIYGSYVYDGNAHDESKSDFYLLDRKGEQPDHQMMTLDTETGYSFSPSLTADGTGILYLEDGTLYISNLSGAPRLRVAEGVDEAWLLKSESRH